MTNLFQRNKHPYTSPFIPPIKTHLGDKLIMLQLLPAFHDSHNASLDLVLPVLVHLEEKPHDVAFKKPDLSISFFKVPTIKENMLDIAISVNLFL